jgi:ribosome-associated translation inhibitor RaiA
MNNNTDNNEMLDLNNIILFSPIRTGSTLVYNILRELFPSNRTIKMHHYLNIFTEKHKIIVTYRNPVASYVSHLLRYMDSTEITKEKIDEYFKEYTDNGWEHLFKAKNQKHILLLKYEDFYNNFDVIFDKLEKYMKVIITNESRNLLKKKYSRKSVKQFQSQYNGFSQYDKVTHIHGNHISKFNGETEYYKQILSDDLQQYLEQKLNKYIQLYKEL